MSSRKKETSSLELRYAELRREYARDWESYKKRLKADKILARSLLATFGEAGIDLSKPLSAYSSALAKEYAAFERKSKAAQTGKPRRGSGSM